LFEIAKALFERHGLAGLSVRAIGREAGLSTMAIYRHFRDRDALIDALMDDGFGAWEATVMAIDPADPLAWLHLVTEAFSVFAVSEPHRFDAAFLLPARTARRYPDDFAAGRSPVIALMKTQIERVQAQGQAVAAPADEVALCLSALAQGLVSMQRAGRFATQDQFFQHYRSVMLRAIHSFLTINDSERRAKTDPP
jgi:AcrR family transcriptional regulator